MNDPRLDKVINTQPYPLLFVTVSGAHLYGFPSPDSDYDLRGVHLLPAAEVLSLHAPTETIESSGIHDGLEVDLVTHDAAKFFGLMLKRNGYVLEQLLSPVVLRTTPTHDRLRELARGCITKYHAYHYLGFAGTQQTLYEKEEPHRVKPLLYLYRVLLTGIHLMRTGVVEANLLKLNDEYKLPYIGELVERKLAGAEKSTLPAGDLEFHRAEYARLVARLREEHERSRLPEMPTAKSDLSELLVSLRLRTIS